MNDLKRKEEWNNILEDNQSIYIYGAGKYAKRALRQLLRDEKEEKVCGFLVSDSQKNPKLIEGKPVLLVNTLKNKEVLILVAVSEYYWKEIESILRSLQFNNVVNVHKYIFLDNEIEDRADVIELKELLQKQCDDKKFCRYDIIVNLLTIEGYYGNNKFGLSLYRKMRNARTGVAVTDFSEKQFIQLVESIEADGYDTDFEILTDKEGKLIGSSYRIALAIYHGISYVKVYKKDKDVENSFDIEWLKEKFDIEERKIILNEYQIVRKKMESDNKSALETLKEEIYCLFGNNQDFGRGEFYQSLEELGIKGQRPTGKRIEEYGLNDIVREKRVLDIGCNCGFLDLSLSLVAKSVCGIEYNGILIKVAEKVKEYLGRDNVHFEVGDFKTYATNRKYDVIFSFAVHYWIGLSVKDYCEKIIYMLEKEGYLIFESQDIKKDSEEFERYCYEFEEMGLKKVREGMICDDGKITRKYMLYQYVV